MLLTFLTLAVVGCGTMANREAPLTDEEKIARAPIAMQGDSGFFGGRVAATVTVSRGFNEELSQRGQRRIDEDQPKLSEVFEKELADQVKNPLGQTITKMSALVDRGSPIPPVVIRLILKNTSAQPIDVEVLEQSSELGNFAIRPSKFTIAPGGVGEPEYVTSRLGVTSGDIPVKVILRVNGQSETQTLRVRNIIPAAAKK